MTPGAGRRRFVASLFAFAATIAGVDARAQNPRATEAQAAAREWLALVDKDDAAASHAAAGARFQEAMPVDRWRDALKAVRGPLGPVEQRTLAGSGFGVPIPGLPPGDYAQLAFRTAWTSKSDGREYLTLERVGGRWKVIGYVVQ